MSRESREYVDLDGNHFDLTKLSLEEQRLLRACKGYFDKNPDWADFHNFWQPKVAAFYSARGLSRPQISKTALFQIGQDMWVRLGIKQGCVRPDDYLSELEELIRTRFKTRREFCKATGLSEDMLSHVLAGRKQLAIDTLSEALERIGYRLRIVPRESVDLQPKRRSPRRAS